MAIDNGYVRIYMPEHKSSDSNGLIYEHQVVAEQKIGRPLKDEEVVHHVDKNRSNNDPNNLLIFASNSDHAAFHQNGEYILDDEGIAHCVAKKNIEHKCLRCGTTVYWTSDYCVICSCFLQRKVSNRPSRDELKGLIRKYPFVKIASMYEVSDNAIRKWCKQEKLPYQSTIIRQMSDSEWELV